MQALKTGAQPKKKIKKPIKKEDPSDDESDTEARSYSVLENIGKVDLSSSVVVLGASETLYGFSPPIFDEESLKGFDGRPFDPHVHIAPAAERGIVTQILDADI